jgi:hypothetical protein
MCVEALFKESDTRSVSADEWTAVFSEEQCQFQLLKGGDKKQC